MFKKPTPDPASPAKEPLWDPKAKAGGRGKHLGVKWSVFALIALVAVALVAGSFRPVHKTVNVLPPEAGVSSVSQYSAAFITDWFTWNQADRRERDARLSVYNPSLVGTTWDGKGTQKVVQALPVEQVKDADGLWRVTVRVQVSTSPAAFYAQVLAAATDDGYAVLSAPALVPAPALLAVEVPAIPVTTEQDKAVVEDITSQVNLFLSAWASADPSLNQFVLEGAYISPIGGGLNLAKVERVAVPAVEEGADPNKRTVIAKASWTWPGGGTSSTHYKISLQRSAGKWFVTSLEGGVGDPEIAPTEGVAFNPAPAPSPAATSTPAPSADPSGVPANGEPDADAGAVESEGEIVDPPFSG